MSEVHAHIIRGIRVRGQIQLKFDWLPSKFCRESTIRELCTRERLPVISVCLSLSFFLSLQWRWSPSGRPSATGAPSVVVDSML